MCFQPQRFFCCAFLRRAVLNPPHADWSFPRFGHSSDSLAPSLSFSLSLFVHCSLMTRKSERRVTTQATNRQAVPASAGDDHAHPRSGERAQPANGEESTHDSANSFRELHQAVPACSRNTAFRGQLAAKRERGSPCRNRRQRPPRRSPE